MERDYFDSGLDAFSDYEMDELSYITRLISVIDRKNAVNDNEKEELSRVKKILIDRKRTLQRSNQGDSLGDELYDAFDGVIYTPEDGYESYDTDLFSEYVYIPGFGHLQSVTKDEVSVGNIDLFDEKKK